TRGARRYSWIDGGDRFPHGAFQAQRIDVRAHDDRAWKPALEHSRCFKLRLRRGDINGGRGWFVEMRLYVADYTDDLAQLFADVEVFAQRAVSRKILASKGFIDDRDAICLR